MGKLRRNDLLYPGLSYQIIGCAFEAHNQVGGGHKEVVYQRAMAQSLRDINLKFEEQVYFPIKFKDKIVGKGFIDFLIDGKIVVEIKKGDKFSKKHIDQVLDYLKSRELKLAVLINFGSNTVSFRRVVNFDS
ncbi:MAG: GxxExxY protein [Patescibacteria group bacterium]